MNLFYSPHTTGDTLELDAQESRHMVRVLRMRTGDRVQLVDGLGGWYEAVIEDDHPGHCRLKLLSRTTGHNPLPYALHIAISPTKSTDRFEWFLEKATEIGITEITPLLCHRTERTRFNADRMERIIISAMKQSLKAYKPDLHEPAALTDFICKDRPGTRGIAHCVSTGPDISGSPDGSTGLDDSASLDDSAGRIHIAELARNQRYTLLVGPEGDFTEEEVHAATDAGYTPFHLGESRLRTETAGVFICAAIRLVSAL